MTTIPTEVSHLIETVLHARKRRPLSTSLAAVRNASTVKSRRVNRVMSGASAEFAAMNRLSWLSPLVQAHR